MQTTNEGTGMTFSRKAVVTIVLGVALVVAGTALYLSHHFARSQYADLYLKNANFGVQLAMYDLYRTTHAEIVMLGDSRTYYGNWNELLGRTDVVNRGISNDITAGFLHRLGYVYRLHPRICFIEGGVNDVYANYTAVDIVENLTMIVDTLREHNIIPVIQSTMFVARERAEAEPKNAEIQKLNQQLLAYCRAHSILFLDINALVSTDGYLRPDLTYDGIHLNARGYALWIPKIQEALAISGL